MTGLQIVLAAIVLPMEKISVKKSMKCFFGCERNQCTTGAFRPPQAIPFIDSDDDNIAGGRCLSLPELRIGQELTSPGWTCKFCMVKKHPHNI